MSIFDKLIKDTVGKAVSSAIGNAVEDAARKAVKPVADEAANAVKNAAAQQVNSAAGEIRQSAAEASASLKEADEAASKVSQDDWDKAMSFLGDMATSAAKNTKVCPACGASAKADVKFCPECGAKLPEMTVYEMEKCPSCGHQNDLGVNFCAECGAKLPVKLAEEENQRKKDEEELNKWDELLPQYPKWRFGGSDIELLDRRDEGALAVLSVGNTDRAALNSYFELLKENGFAGPLGWTDDELLFKVIGGNAYCVSRTDAFRDEDCFSIYFMIDNSRLPKKEEPKKKGLFGGLFG